MVAMAHVRQMEKSDRDPTQAQMAELELQNFVSSYPDSPLLDEAKEKLRAVQEVLADGVLQIANYYSTVRSYPAATTSPFFTPSDFMPLASLFTLITRSL